MALVINCITILVALLSVVVVTVAEARLQSNLLFIMSETARADDFEMLGGMKGITPSMTRFFSQRGSIRVSQAHVDFPLCNPSRTAIMLGRDPDATGVKTNFLDWKSNPEADGWRTLPGLLKDNGWFTMLGGKVFHRFTNDITSWSRVFDSDNGIDYKQCHNDRKAKRIRIGKNQFFPQTVGCFTRTGILPDLTLAFAAQSELKRWSQRESKDPFAMFVGFDSPHTPIRVNYKYQISMKQVSSSLPLVEPSRNRAEFAVDYSFDSPKRTKDGVLGSDPDRSSLPVFVKAGGPFGAIGPLKAHRDALRHLHLSGLKQTDSAMGIVLSTLRLIGELDNTIVVFLTDHGFAYGETRAWEKDLPLDIATRVPLLFRIPSLNVTAFNTPGNFIMNTIDLYRTISGFLGVGDKVDPSIGGLDRSGYFTSLAESRRLGTSPPPPASTMAFSQVIRCTNPDKCAETTTDTDVVGYTVRTEMFRYNVYLHAVDGQVTNYTRTNIIAEELFDHRLDNLTIYNPNGATYQGHEMTNVVSQFPSVAKDLFEMILARFATIPKAKTLPRAGG